MAGYRPTNRRGVPTNRRGVPTTQFRPMARGPSRVGSEFFGAANGISPGAGARARRIAAAQRVAELDRRRRLGGGVGWI